MVTANALERFRRTMRRRIEENGQILLRVHKGAQTRFYGRIAQQDMKAWTFSPLDSGAGTGRKPYLFCEWSAELESGDIVIAAQGSYQCDEVSYPYMFGGRTHCTSALKEVRYGE
jgi:hypothetical protein